MTGAVLGHEATAKAFPAVVVPCQCYCLCACVSFVLVLDVENGLCGVCVCVCLEMCTMGCHSFLPQDANGAFYISCSKTQAGSTLVKSFDSALSAGTFY